MFKVEIKQSTRPYIRMSFNTHVDTLYEAEIIAHKLICGYFISRHIELVHVGNLKYEIYDHCALVGDVSIMMLD